MVNVTGGLVVGVVGGSGVVVGVCVGVGVGVGVGVSVDTKGVMVVVKVGIVGRYGRTVVPSTGGSVVVPVFDWDYIENS